jgi:hypothetical protein
VGATRDKINSPERSVYRPAIRKIKRREESREEKRGEILTARSKAHASISVPFSTPSQSPRLLFSSDLSNPSAARGREQGEAGTEAELRAGAGRGHAVPFHRSGALTARAAPTVSPLPPKSPGLSLLRVLVVTSYIFCSCMN